VKLCSLPCGFGAILPEAGPSRTCPSQSPFFWGDNPVRKVTPVILHGIVSPLTFHRVLASCRQARAAGGMTVKPEWILECEATARHVSEAHFAV
jgi:hypothetical protein